VDDVKSFVQLGITSYASFAKSRVAQKTSDRKTRPRRACSNKLIRLDSDCEGQRRSGEKFSGPEWEREKLSTFFKAF
jgi:hypothetical protein